MKKKIVTMMMAIVLLGAGCGANQQAAPESEVEFEQVPETDASEDTGDELEVISEQEALLAALKQAGLSESDVTVTKMALDMDDGQQIYEIEFVTADMEYEYDVNATTGSIVSFSQEPYTGVDDD